MSNVLRKLGIEIDVFGNNTGLNRIESSLSSITAKANVLAGILGGAFAFHQAKAFIMDAINFGDQFADQSMRLGLSAEQLQEWSFIAEQAGVSGEMVAQGVGRLNQSLGEAQLGNEKAAETFASLGINIRKAGGGFKDTNDVIFELSDKLAKLPTVAQKTAYAAKLGGRGFKELGVVLGQGSDALREQIALLYEVGGVLPNELAGGADKFKDKLNLINKSWQVSKTTLVMQLMPQLIKLTAWFSKGMLWLSKFEEKTGLVSAAMQTLGIIAGAVALKMAVSFALANAPLLLAGAAILGILLVAEDLYYFLTGEGDTFIEDFIKQTMGVEKGKAAIDIVRSGFNDFLTILKQVKDILGPITDMIDRVGATVGLFKEMAPGGAFDPTSTRTLADFRKELDEKRGLYPSRVRKDLLDSTRHTAGVVSTPVQALAGPAQIMRNYISATPTPLSNSNSTNNVTNNININGGDLNEVRRVVQESVRSEYVTANENFKTKKVAQ